MKETTMVIPDTHSIANDPDQERFTILGELMVDRQPANVVHIGDFMTYDSISYHNLNRRLTMEGQRLRTELDAGIEAYDRMMSPLKELNDSRRKNRKALYKPNMFLTSGNHRDRAARYVDQNPEMLGLVDFLNFIPWEEDGWVVVPYKEYCEINEVLFTHIPVAGNNQPQSSIHLNKNILREHACSVVYGHTHAFGAETEGIKTAYGYKRISSLNVGCYFDHKPDYAKTSKGIRNWWSGVCLLHHLNDEGDYDLETISLSRLREMYG